MKKLLITLLLILLSFMLIAQERELSDYEKYRMEKENELNGQQQEEVFFIVEDMPQFNGGNAEEFRKWITKSVRYPQEAAKNNVSGKVYIQFAVNSRGEVVDAIVVRGVDPYLDAEALRVVNTSPKWTAGKQRGVAVKVRFTFPINFVLDNQKKSEPVVINNYYNYNQPNYRFLMTFGYAYRPYYQPNYDYYDPYYYGGYYRYNSYYGSYYYPYWGWNRYYGSYWGYNNYNYWNRPKYYAYNYRKPKTRDYTYGYRQSRSAYSNSKPVVRTTRTVATTTKTSNVRRKPIYTQRDRSSYTPSYTKPTVRTRPQYNPTVTTTTRNSYNPSINQKSTRISTRPSLTTNKSYTPSRSSSPSRSTTINRSSSSRSSESVSRSSGASRSSSSGGKSKR